MENLKEFNAELQTLLDKYGLRLQIDQRIVVVPSKAMEEETIVETPTETVEEIPEEVVEETEE